MALPLSSLQILQDLSFSKDKIKHWSRLFRNSLSLSMRAELIAKSGLMVLEIIGDKNSAIKTAIHAYNRKVEDEDERNFSDCMDFIVEYYQASASVRSAHLLSRIMSFQFKSINRDTIQAFRKLVEEYNEISDTDLADQIVSNSLVKGSPSDFLTYCKGANVDFNSPESIIDEMENWAEKTETINTIKGHSASVSNPSVHSGSKKSASNQDVDMVNFNGSKSKSFSSSSNQKSTSCRNCGRSAHKAGETCPAVGKTCNKCGKNGHFSPVCKSGGKQSGGSSGSKPASDSAKQHKTKNVSQNLHTKAADDDSDIEYVFFGLHAVHPVYPEADGDSVSSTSSFEDGESENFVSLPPPSVAAAAAVSGAPVAHLTSLVQEMSISPVVLGLTTPTCGSEGAVLPTFENPFVLSPLDSEGVPPAVNSEVTVHPSDPSVHVEPAASVPGEAASSDAQVSASVPAETDAPEACYFYNKATSFKPRSKLTEAIADSGCSVPLFPMWCEKYMYKKHVKVTKVQSAYDSVTRDVTYGYVDCEFTDIDNKKRIVTVLGSLSNSKGTTSLLLPAHLMDTTQKGKEYFYAGSVKVSIIKHRALRLWITKLRLVTPSETQLANITAGSDSDAPADDSGADGKDQDDSSSDKKSTPPAKKVKTVSKTSDASASSDPACVQQPLFTPAVLKKLGIYPMTHTGLPLSASELCELESLFIQLMHVRTLHFGPDALHRFFKHSLSMDVSVSKIRSAVKTCKACACKVTLKNPKKKKAAAKSKGKKTKATRAKSTAVSSSSSSSESSDECDISGPSERELLAATKPAKDFNHLLYQDCAEFPPSILKKFVKCSVIIDSFSSFMDCEPILTANSSETAQHLKRWFDTHGSPHSVQTDNGPEFDGQYHALLLDRTVLHRRGVPYFPQQQGKVERANRTLRLHTDLYLRANSFPENLWTWGVHATCFAHNHLIPSGKTVSPLQSATGKAPRLNLWPGDRVAFHPRSLSDKNDDPRTIHKLLVGEFQGIVDGHKHLVMFRLPNEWQITQVDKVGLRQLPITLSDAIRRVQEGFDEPDNIDRAVLLATGDDKSKKVTLPPSPKVVETVLLNRPIVTRGRNRVLSDADAGSSGKTHLDVSRAELAAGSHDAAIEKEFNSFVKNDVFAPRLSVDEAKSLGYSIVSFKGIPSWKLKDGKRVAKWRGVCRGFEDSWSGDVDTDTPSPSSIKLAFVVAQSRGWKAAYADGTTAFLQVPVPPDRKIAVRLGDYVPKALLSRFQPGGIYPLRKMLYGLKDSPRKWVLFLRDQLQKLGFSHIGYGIYKSKDALCVTYIDDIFVWSEDPLATLRSLAKHVELDEPTEFKCGSVVRYIGTTIKWSIGGIEFDIGDYCKDLTSTCTERPLAPSRTLIEKLLIKAGQPNRTFLKDIGKLGWVSAHHHSTQYAYSFFSRYSRGECPEAQRMVRFILERLRFRPPPPYFMHPIDLSKAILICFTDAALSRTAGVAQLGAHAQVTDEKSLEVDKQVDCFNNTLCVKSSKCKRVVRSTGQAELAALSMGIDITVDLVQQLKALDVTVHRIIFYIDAKVVLDQLKNPSKAEVHSRLQAMFCAQVLSDLKAEVAHVGTKEQKADGLTKFLYPTENSGKIEELD